MSDYLVSKLENTELDSIEDKGFDSLKAAEEFALKKSQDDNFYSYSVKRKIDEHEYEAIKIYKLGKLAIEIKTDKK
jgi:hypothetical protein